MSWSDVLNPEIVWLIIGLVLLILEFAVPGLVIFFFGLGALLVGALCYAFNLSLNAQIVLFLVSSVGMLISLRQSLSRVFLGHATDSEVSEDALEVVGERVKVIQPISPQATGKVEFHGAQWQAACTCAVPEGRTVEVVGRDNLNRDLITIPAQIHPDWSKFRRIQSDLKPNRLLVRKQAASGDYFVADVLCCFCERLKLAVAGGVSRQYSGQ